MTPTPFISFRDRLDAASGFQSRAVPRARVRARAARRPARRPLPAGRRRRAERIGDAMARPSLLDSFLRYLAAPGLRRPARRARARRHRAARPRVAGGAGRARRRLPRDGPEVAGLRAARRPRRRDPGVALPPRQDGRAHDRRQAGHRRLDRRRVPAHDALPAALPRPLGDPARCDALGDLRVAERAAPSTTRASASPSGCCSPGTRTRPGPTSRSRASSRRSTTPPATSTTSGSAPFAKAERVRAGYRALLDDPGGEIALGASTHELVVRLLSALDSRARPRLVTTDGEFHTLRRQLARLAEAGIEVVRAAGRSGRRRSPSAWPAAIDERTARRARLRGLLRDRAHRARARRARARVRRRAAPAARRRLPRARRDPVRRCARSGSSRPGRRRRLQVPAARRGQLLPAPARARRRAAAGDHRLVRRVRRAGRRARPRARRLRPRRRSASPARPTTRRATTAPRASSTSSPSRA